MHYGDALTTLWELLVSITSEGNGDLEPATKEYSAKYEHSDVATKVIHKYLVNRMDQDAPECSETVQKPEDGHPRKSPSEPLPIIVIILILRLKESHHENTSEDAKEKSK